MCIHTDPSPHAALSYLSLSGTSGQEVTLSDRPVSKVDVENPILEGTGSCGGSSEGEYSDEEQGYVSSVVSGQQRQQQRRVHWGDLPCPETENQTQSIEPQVSSVGHKGERDDEAKVSGPVSDPVSVDETMELLQQVDLSDTSRAASTQSSRGTSFSISQVGMSKKTADGLRNLLKSHEKVRAEAPAVTLGLLEALTRTLMEWRTEETMR